MSVLLGAELNPSLLDLFEKRITTVILATLDENNCPHTAPFYYLVASDPKHLRVAISRNHQTFHNITVNSNVAVSVVDEGDIAVCIKGSASVYLENMESDYNMAVVDIEINQIKKDNWTSHFVTQGIRIRHRNEPALIASRKIFQELLKG